MWLLNFFLTINSLHRVNKVTRTFSVLSLLLLVDSIISLLKWNAFFHACDHSSWFKPSTSHREPSRSTPKYTRLIEQSTPRADRPISPHCTFAAKYRGASLKETSIMWKFKPAPNKPLKSTDGYDSAPSLCWLGISVEVLVSSIEVQETKKSRQS